MTKQEIEEALEDCETAISARNCPFTDWEEEFIGSVQEQFLERGGLSDKQCETLQKIWDKV